MIEFKEDKPIYRQIIDYAYARILNGDWTEGQRVPSVRELGAEMAVNTHTILKAYDHLTDCGIIASRRGMGYFLQPDARAKVIDQQRRFFFDNTLNNVFAQMRLLDISIDDVVARW